METTVKDLIEHLKQFPQDMPIKTTDSFDGMPMDIYLEDIYIKDEYLKIGISIN